MGEKNPVWNRFTARLCHLGRNREGLICNKSLEQTRVPNIHFLSTCGFSILLQTICMVFLFHLVWFLLAFIMNWPIHLVAISSHAQLLTIYRCYWGLSFQPFKWIHPNFGGLKEILHLPTVSLDLAKWIPRVMPTHFAPSMSICMQSFKDHLLSTHIWQDLGSIP